MEDERKSFQELFRHGKNWVLPLFRGAVCRSKEDGRRKGLEKTSLSLVHPIHLMKRPVVLARSFVKSLLPSFQTPDLNLISSPNQPSLTLYPHLFNQTTFPLLQTLPLILESLLISTSHPLISNPLKSSILTHRSPWIKARKECSFGRIWNQISLFES